MSQSNPIHIAILDLYDGSANVGMDCIMDILEDWSKKQSVTICYESNCFLTKKKYYNNVSDN